MNQAKTYMALHQLLPCGCSLTMNHIVDHENYPETATSTEWVPEAAEKLKWYFDNVLVARHKCELVSEDNPNGVDKRR